ncbi:hypothetical protein [Oceanobacillus oncorhynchi]|nr:hypothetical protein [Oceanobacillus oncorhynchi]
MCFVCLLLYNFPSDKSVYHWDFLCSLELLNGGKVHENY